MIGRLIMHHESMFQIDPYCDYVTAKTISYLKHKTVNLHAFTVYFMFCFIYAIDYFTQLHHCLRPTLIFS